MPSPLPQFQRHSPETVGCYRGPLDGGCARTQLKPLDKLKILPGGQEPARQTSLIHAPTFPGTGIAACPSALARLFPRSLPALCAQSPCTNGVDNVLPRGKLEGVFPWGLQSSVPMSQVASQSKMCSFSNDST